MNSLRRDRLARARKDGRGTARPSSGGSCVEAAVSGGRTKRDCGDVRKNFKKSIVNQFHRFNQLEKSLKRSFGFPRNFEERKFEESFFLVKTSPLLLEVCTKELSNMFISGKTVVK